ncbi:hypothetical protein E2562_034668 [Oryza meyeriana var. granulata]|uniref:Uncharacterized protein n=1 Tax=Oryza meyeriana var. granulata TaxID=110450 RepID=A0A6G1EBD7_9ORYZ|nr:hypothetical protein E2562_034668 [Oryza meyeriana var. granulata]
MAVGACRGTARELGERSSGEPFEGTGSESGRGRHGDVGAMCREMRQAWERGARTGSRAAHGGCRAAEAGTAWEQAMRAGAGASRPGE